ncbi:hypothetical protein HELRODRAFT_182053 [Helobdella robusta]|uniref:Uncharacterized protein n=1 Tax=Helobdella robusta TaxID=6412 RepID=T1FHN7_HELRO|nr:hypothetical protein HELRODRAFT_182053 [Helobdella robusta]ESN91875.1 hypothetical protein HELRODRAFT_182053 [Helobdella robusta]
MASKVDAYYIDPLYHHIVWGIIGTVHIFSSIFSIAMLALEGVFSSQPIAFLLQLFPFFGKTYHVTILIYLSLNGFMSIADVFVALLARAPSFQTQNLRLPRTMASEYQSNRQFRHHLHLVQSQHNCCGIHSTLKNLTIHETGCQKIILEFIEHYFCLVTLLTLTLAFQKTVLVAVSFVAMPRKSALIERDNKASLRASKMKQAKDRFLLFPTKKSLKYDFRGGDDSSASGRGGSLSGGSGVGLRISSSSSKISTAGLTYEERLKNVLKWNKKYGDDNF